MARKHTNAPHGTTVQIVDDMGERSDIDHSNGQDGGEAPNLPLETFPPQPARAEGIATPERTGADVIAELSAARLRIELAQIEWDRLADELGWRAKDQHKTRVPVRIGGSLYRFKFTEATEVYSLVQAADPTEIA